MKTKTLIEEVETHDAQGNVKKTRAGKVFARFKTSMGWAGCFEQNIIETLKELKGHEVVLFIEKSADGKYNTIKGIYPDGEQEEETDYTDAVRRTNEQDGVIGKPKDNTDFPKRVAENGLNKQRGAYDKDPVGLAVELMIGYMSNLNASQMESLDFSVTMGQCCQVVYNARKILG